MGSAVNRDEPPQDEEQFTLSAGLVERNSLRADVLGFCERNGLSCEVSERSQRLLATQITFRVRGAREAISSLAGYLEWTGRTFRTGGPEPRRE
jgi:hypothetical protein